MIFSWNMQPKILENEKITLYIFLDFGYIIVLLVLTEFPEEVS